MGRTVFDYMQAVQMVIDSIPKETESIVKRNSQQIIELNTDDQLYNKGIDSEGQRLFPPYANITRQIKAGKSQPFNRVTLFDTGDFYKGFKIKYNYPILNIYSADSKSSDLMDKYGSNIFGLVTENQKVLNYAIIQPELHEFIKKHL